MKSFKGSTKYRQKSQIDPELPYIYTSCNCDAKAFYTLNYFYFSKPCAVKVGQHRFKFSGFRTEARVASNPVARS